MRQPRPPQPQPAGARAAARRRAGARTTRLLGALLLLGLTAYGGSALVLRRGGGVRGAGGAYCEARLAELGVSLGGWRRPLGL